METKLQLVKPPAAAVVALSCGPGRTWNLAVDHLEPGAVVMRIFPPQGLSYTVRLQV